MKNTQGAPPHPKPWPVGERYDVALLEYGDTRNVIDKYRYWTEAAIRHDMQSKSAGLEVAIENWQHDFNIGTIVRNANAFNVRRVHIIGKRHWNRRGAMKTEAYLEVIQHSTVHDFINVTGGLYKIAVDNVPGAKNLSRLDMPKKTVLVFGGEGPGLSREMREVCDDIVQIEQFGSTRSMNVGVASGILLYKWAQQHILNEA